LMSAGCTNRSPRDSAINCDAHVEAPLSSRALPASAAGASMRTTPSVLQVGLGYNKRYWLHVPIGVGIFGWLTRQVNRLDAMWRTTGARS
jgi:hypothetical protein